MTSPSMTSSANPTTATRPGARVPHNRGMCRVIALSCLLAVPLGAAAHPGHAPVQGVLDVLLHQPWTLGALLLAAMVGGHALLRRMRARR